MALPDFTMRQLLEAGVHFGHQTHRWNPKMETFLFGNRNNIHIIDLAQTVPLLHQALVAVRDVVAGGGRVLFVGTKDMGGIPDLMFVIDTNKETIAIQEARKLGIPVVAILDSNCDPDGIAYPIPGNDDAARAISLYTDLISRAVIDGISQSQGSMGVDIGAEAEPMAEPALADAPAAEEAPAAEAAAEPAAETPAE